MIISRDQTIAGHPAVQLRDLMRRVRGRAFSVLGLADDQGITEGEPSAPASSHYPDVSSTAAADASYASPRNGHAREP